MLFRTKYANFSNPIKVDKIESLQNYLENLTLKEPDAINPDVISSEIISFLTLKDDLEVKMAQRCISGAFFVGLQKGSKFRFCNNNELKVFIPDKYRIVPYQVCFLD